MSTTALRQIVSLYRTVWALRSHTGQSLVAAALVLALAAASQALAVEGQIAGHGHGPSEALLLVEIALLILTGRLLGEGMQRIGMPTVMGQLLAGVMLGPSLFGLLWPEGQKMVFPDMPEQQAMLEAFSQVGILFILLLAGMETDITLVRKAKRAVISASFTGIVIPFAVGFLLGQNLPSSLVPDPEHRIIVSLFLGTALSISSVKIVAVVVREMGFERRNIGQIIVSSAIIDDTIAWTIIAIVLGLAAHSKFDIPILIRSVVGTLLFLAFSLTIGRRIVFKIILTTKDLFVSEAAVISVILLIMSAMALITQWIGVQTVLGAFVAGILIGQSPAFTREIDEQIRGLTAALFMPVFFGLAGLRADLTVLSDPRLLVLTGVMILIATIGKAAGAFAGGFLGGLRPREAVAVAAGMNARGSTQFIVATIGLSLGLLNRDLFTMIVAMAFVTTILMPPTLRWALRRVPLEGDEKERLEREEFEQKAFLTNVERMLLAVDESPSGKVATRLAALLAGPRGMPITLLRLPETDVPQWDENAFLTSVREVANQAAQTPEGDKEQPPAVEVTAHVHDLPPAEAVKAEAPKGYGLFMIGMEPATTSKGEFQDRISELARNFEGSLAIAVARGVYTDDPFHKPMEILVPITGSGVSFRGMEVALAIAKAASAPITALSLASAAAGGNASEVESEKRHASSDDSEILREAGRISEYFSVDVHSIVGKGDTREAILEAAGKSSECLIVLGVSRRPGESLSFGHIATGLIEQSEHSLLLISS